jgi:hypothetical protein
MDSPIIAYRIDITKQGGFIRGRADSGPFQLGPLGFDIIGAIATVVRGPRAAFDAYTNTFSCQGDSSIPKESLIADTAKENTEESTDKALGDDTFTSPASNAFPGYL